MHNGIFFLVLLSAHLLGDFYLQTPTLATKKEKEYSGILKHSLIYALLFTFIYLINETPWWLLAIAAGAHWIIDSVKWLLRNKPLSKPLLFVIDQIFHLLTLLLIVGFTLEIGIRPWLARLPIWIWASMTLLLLIWKPGNISLDILFEKYASAAKKEARRLDQEAVQKQQIAELTDNNQLSTQHNENQSDPIEVEGAGAWVGTFERIITVLFAYLGQYAAMGLLIAAKSMARYDKISKGSAFAEYYLIGTLYSILFAIIAYLFVFKIVLPISPVIPPTPILVITPTPLP
ncbi:MAG: DUF3307 domain-containing protein [Anaerolineaceae bacterium]|jgi:hypothetical protein|nr:DUF3307 domain-containing protein [Anaerolineaceae bacterium]